MAVDFDTYCYNYCISNTLRMCESVRGWSSRLSVCHGDEAILMARGYS